MKSPLFFIILFAYSFLSGQTRKSAICSSEIFAHSPNALGVAGDINTYRQNNLVYDRDLNAVLWIHNASVFWNFSGNTQGAIQSTWLDLTTGSWDSMIVYRDSSNNYGGRYPTGIFYDQVGNTNISNAYVAALGPTRDLGWNGIFYSTRQINGNYHQVSAAQEHNSICLPGAPPFFGQFDPNNAKAFLNADIQCVGNDVMVAGGLPDKSLNSANLNTEYGGTLARLSSSTWGIDSIIPGFYFGVNGYCNDKQGMRIAFSPNGQIGYAVFIGRPATIHGNSSDSTLSPIVYKSTNAGISWFSLPGLEGFDWSIGHPEAIKKGGSVGRSQTRNLYKLYLNHGIDLTVDSLGVLHLVGTVTDPYIETNGSTDSLTFEHTYNWDYITQRPKIWDFMTDGSPWNALLVDSLMTGELGADTIKDTTTVYNPWKANGTYFAYGARIQVSRSPTGGKVFYSWADSDPSVTGMLLNTHPDIYLKYYDVSNQVVSLYSGVTATQGAGDGYFHFMSDISYYDTMRNGWVCPIVYATAHSTTFPYYNGADTIDYHYINCVSFDNNVNTMAAHIYYPQPGACWGIANNDPLHSIVNNYPNPFSHSTTITVTLGESENFTLRIYDLLGNEIHSTSLKGTAGLNKYVFEGSSLRAGVYYYTIIIGNTSVVRKMILQK